MEFGRYNFFNPSTVSCIAVSPVPLKHFQLHLHQKFQEPAVNTIFIMKTTKLSTQMNTGYGSLIQNAWIPEIFQIFDTFGIQIFG